MNKIYLDKVHDFTGIDIISGSISNGSSSAGILPKITIRKLYYKICKVSII